MEEIKESVDCRKLFADHIKNNGTSKVWVADQTDISPGHLYEILKCHRKLTERNRKKLNELFNTDF